jgi:hypothetical protein
MNLLLAGVAISAGVSLCITVVIWWLGRDRMASIAAPAGFACGLVSGYAYAEYPRLVAKPDWLVWFAVIACVLAIVLQWRATPVAVRWMGTATFAVAAAWFLVPVRPALESIRPMLVAILAAAIALEWNLLDELAQRSRQRSVFWTVAASLASASAMVAFAVSIKIGFVGAAAAAALSGSLAIAIQSSGRGLQTMLGPVTVVLMGILLRAYLYDGLTVLIIGLMLSAPLLLWLFELSPLKRLTSIRGVLAKGIVAGTPQAAAWILVVMQH